MTLEDFPLWSFWIREYSEAGGREHWVLFMIESHERDQDDDDDVVSARVVAAVIPAAAGTSHPGDAFNFSPTQGNFARLIKRLS